MARIRMGLVPVDLSPEGENFRLVVGVWPMKRTFSFTELQLHAVLVVLKQGLGSVQDMKGETVSIILIRPGVYNCMMGGKAKDFTQVEVDTFIKLVDDALLQRKT